MSAAATMSAAAPSTADGSAATTSHINATSMGVNPTICRYFQRGICRFGAMCRFSHDLSGGETISSNSNNSNNDVAGVANDGPCTQPSTSRHHLHHNWANAPVFVPQHQMRTQAAANEAANNGNVHKSWADVVGAELLPTAVQPSGTAADLVCPYESPCPYGPYCQYGVHMELCKMCDQYCLHPHDQAQRRKHNQECLQQHEQAMELSFAIARSKDKTCGICFDTIMEKSGREKRFGILPNCNHIFCLECIRKWRQAKQFEHKITRSCPECRVSSDFVCPSAFWVETKEEKDKLLSDYRSALGVKDCKYFKKGDGKCPFGNKCFYKHALPSGELVDVGCPKRARKLHRSSNEIIDLLDIYLWEFVEHRDYHWLDFLSSTSDDSDDTDYDTDD